EAQRQLAASGGAPGLHYADGRVEAHVLDRFVHLRTVGDLGLVLQAGQLIVGRALQREDVSATLGTQPGEGDAELAHAVAPAFLGVRLVVLMNGRGQKEPPSVERGLQLGQVVDAVLDLDLAGLAHAALPWRSTDDRARLTRTTVPGGQARRGQVER